MNTKLWYPHFVGEKDIFLTSNALKTFVLLVQITCSLFITADDGMLVELQILFVYLQTSQQIFETFIMQILTGT